MTLQDLPVGYPFETQLFSLKEEEVREYLTAIGDTLSIYQDLDLSPPLGLVARVVRGLITQLSLPSGSTHIAQEVEWLRAIPAAVDLMLESWVSKNSARGNLRFMSIGFEVLDGDKFAVMRGDSTVLMPN